MAQAIGRAHTGNQGGKRRKWAFKGIRRKVESKGSLTFFQVVILKSLAIG
jgi:hypothetical protein